MPGYIFLFDAATGTFPERYRVVEDNENADEVRRCEGLTGTVPATAAAAFLEALTARFPPGHSTRAERVQATTWCYRSHYSAKISRYSSPRQLQIHSPRWRVPDP